MISKMQETVIKEVIRPFNPAMIGIFGSYARSENTLSSDLDILVDIKNDINLLDLIGIEQELSDKLGLKVDLVTARCVNPDLRDYIQKDLVKIM